jgi:hypothetical protein
VIQITTYDEINELIHQHDPNEVECGKYLKYIPNFMIKKEHSTQFIKDSTEVPGFRGRSDFIISAKIDEGGVATEKLFIWELKAPQSNIFNIIEGNKLAPSNYLIDVENKLLNYVDEIQKSEATRESFSIAGSVIQSRNVIPDGLIISRNDLKLWEKGKPINNRDADYEVAKRIREEFFYRCCNIKLYTWDDVLIEIKKTIVENGEYKGKEIVSEEKQEKPDTKII